MKKIGLITWHYFRNFGSMLQAFALQNTLRELKYNAVFINYRDLKYGKVNVFKDKLRYFASEISRYMPSKFKNRFYFPYIFFSEKYLKQTKYIFDKNILPKYGKKYYAIICGSDQIWAPNVFNPVYMINFSDGKKVKKISYAASIGLNDIPENLQGEYKKLLSDFSFVSVREKTGKELLENKCGISSTVVLDPTFLLKPEEYRKLEKKPFDFCKKKKFIFCYFLNKDNKYRETVEKYASEKGYEIIGYSARTQDASWMEFYKNIGPREFLWLIDNSDGVFTDSYHGTIFSLLFHKRFWTFERFKSDDLICQNSRIFQLGRIFNIASRIITENSAVDILEEIDYNEFEKKLEVEKKASIEFLREALK